MDHQILNLRIFSCLKINNFFHGFDDTKKIISAFILPLSIPINNCLEINSPNIYKICNFRIGCWHEMNKIKDWCTRLHLLKSVHFKKTVAQSSFLSKVLSFLLKSKQSQRKWRLWKKWGLRNCLLKMNGLYLLWTKTGLTDPSSNSDRANWCYLIVPIWIVVKALLIE